MATATGQLESLNYKPDLTAVNERVLYCHIHPSVRAVALLRDYPVCARCWQRYRYDKVSIDARQAPVTRPTTAELVDLVTRSVVTAHGAAETHKKGRQRT